jgi:hypothetical protein
LLKQICDFVAGSASGAERHEMKAYLVVIGCLAVMFVQATDIGTNNADSGRIIDVNLGSYA